MVYRHVCVHTVSNVLYGFKWNIYKWNGNERNRFFFRLQEIRNSGRCRSLTSVHSHCEKHDLTAHKRKCRVKKSDKLSTSCLSRSKMSSRSNN